jgi:hypothetical protein
VQGIFEVKVIEMFILLQKTQEQNIEHLWDFPKPCW